MASVASQLIEKVTAHVQSDSLKDAREICTDGTYFLNNLRNSLVSAVWDHRQMYFIWLQGFFVAFLNCRFILNVYLQLNTSVHSFSEQ